MTKQQGKFADIDLPEAPSDMKRALDGEADAEPGTVVFPAPAQPYGVAKQLMQDVYTDGEQHPVLAYWRGDWWAYKQTHWVRHTGSGRDTDLEINGQLYKVFDLAVYEKKSGKSTTLVPWEPTPARIAAVVGALKPLAHDMLPDNVDAPAFVGESTKLPGAPGEYVSMRNGLFRWTTRTMVPHTPALFTTYSLPYEYQPEAEAPVWDAFLTDVFEHDHNARLALQEFAGYVVSGRTHMHKGLLIIGPTRAGKGVIERVLKNLVGVQNAATPNLDSLGSDSGPAALIGKPLAVIGDARAVQPSRSSRVTELLLNIIGEDGVSLFRKYESNWDGQLPTRFVLASNEVPRFADASGAVVGRFISMRLVKSYKGREDKTLDKRLEGEMPGILNWALDGLKRLEQQGHFTEPDTMKEMTEHLEGLASPVSQFIADCLEVTAERTDMVPRSEVYRAWKNWHEDNGTQSANAEVMCNRLQAADPRISYGMRDVPGAALKPGQSRPPRDRFVIGVKMNPNNYHQFS